MVEIGCGDRGGLVRKLAARGYEPVGVDPRAPDGGRFRKLAFEEWDEPGPWDAAVCGRVLHHVEPLGPAIERLAGLAPLVLVDEFAWNHIDDATGEWYEGQHRMLRASGHAPPGPATVEEWRAAHEGLHTYEQVRAELDARFRERVFIRRPYLYRWLDGPSSEALEESLTAAGAIRPIGWLYAGVARTSTARTSAESL